MVVKTIYLDLDGVLADNCTAILRRHGVNPDTFVWPPGVYKLEKVLGITSAQLWPPCSDHQFWATLEPTQECYRVIGLAERLVGAQNVYILSRPATHAPASASAKLAWLRYYLPPYADRYVLTKHKGLLARPDALLVDDFDDNVDDFTAAGGKAVLLPRVWNRRHAERPDRVYGELEAACGGKEVPCARRVCPEGAD